MNLCSLPRSATVSYLRLVRLPLDAAISMLPGRRAGAHSAGEEREHALGRRDEPNQADADLAEYEERATQAARARPRGAMSFGRTEQPTQTETTNQDTVPRSDEQIAARAYELYERGAAGGADAHWLAAERELMSGG
jgi:Protein of unknown function (DUF2934)